MYIIREIYNKVYEIAKFEDSREPLDVYTIKYNKCNCPAYTANCKHKKILQVWLDSGKPYGTFIDDNLKLNNFMSKTGPIADIINKRLQK